MRSDCTVVAAMSAVNEFVKLITMRPVGNRSVEVTMPMHHLNGDRVRVFFDVTDDGAIRIHDNGVTVKRLLECFFVSDPTNLPPLLDAVLAWNGLTRRAGRRVAMGDVLFRMTIAAHLVEDLIVFASRILEACAEMDMWVRSDAIPPVGLMVKGDVVKMDGGPTTKRIRMDSDRRRFIFASVCSAVFAALAMAGWLR